MLQILYTQKRKKKPDWYEKKFYYEYQASNTDQHFQPFNEIGHSLEW